MLQYGRQSGQMKGTFQERPKSKVVTTTNVEDFGSVVVGRTGCPRPGGINEARPETFLSPATAESAFQRNVKRLAAKHNVSGARARATLCQISSCACSLGPFWRQTKQRERCTRLGTTLYRLTAANQHGPHEGLWHIITRGARRAYQRRLRGTSWYGHTPYVT